MRRPTLFKDMFKKLIQRESGEWLEKMSGWIGDLDGNVDAGDGLIYVRLGNGDVEEVLNRVAPGRPDLPVRIGRSRTMPTVWQVIDFRSVFDKPPGDGSIKYHGHQHMFDAEDMVPIHRKQIIQLTVLVSPNDGPFYVRVYGDVRLTPDGYVKISTQARDLSSYVPTTGAVYVAIESDEDGVLSDHVGDPIVSPQAATPADMPVPAAGKHTRAIVLLYEGQAALTNGNIRVPMPPDFNPADFASLVHDHALDDLTDVNAPSPTDGQVLTYDFYSGEWIAADPAGGGGGASSLDDLTDVILASLADGDILIYDNASSQWMNVNNTSISHTLATAVDDFLVASGAGAFVKKTLAQTVTILRTVIDAIYAPIAEGVTNGDSHDHVGGDGAVLSYTTVIGTFLSNVTVPASSTYHSCPWKPLADATSNNFPWPEGGVLSHLAFRKGPTSQPASGDLVVTLFVNGSATALTVTIPAGTSGSAATFEDNTHTVNLVAGDQVRWVFANAATAASAQLTSVSMRLTKQTT